MHLNKCVSIFHSQLPLPNNWIPSLGLKNINLKLKITINNNIHSFVFELIFAVVFERVEKDVRLEVVEQPALFDRWLFVVVLKVSDSFQ